MLVYVEVLTCLLPAMMAPAAEGTHPTSAYQPETLLLTSENIEVLEVWMGPQHLLHDCI